MRRGGNAHAPRGARTVTLAGRAGAAVLTAGIGALLVLGAACSTTGGDDAAPLAQFEGQTAAPQHPPSFASHQAEARAALERRRHYVSADVRSETEWNLPREWRPPGAPTGGVLLVHGLGDSPWSFVDIAPRLAEQGMLVRTVLLPGHGTVPSDLLDVRLEDWQRVLREQVAALRDTVGIAPLYLGGFSTGANLVLDYAHAHPEIAGLLLYSPALRSGSRWEWLTPWLAPLKPWLLPTGEERPQQTPVRYLNTPTNGFAQYYRSNVAARAALDARPYDKPALLVVAQHDSVVDAHYVRQVFGARFTHPSSRLIWYGAGHDAGGDATRDGRVLVRPDRLPAERISQFSHMGLLFSDANPLYGRRGSMRLCLNGQDGPAYQRCLDGAQVWYSDWGYREPGKVHARLTYNPYFMWQTAVMLSVLGLGDAPQAPTAAPSSASR